MFVRARYLHLVRLLSLPLAATLVSGMPVAAQALTPAQTPAAKANFDPAEVHLQAYLAARAAEDAEKDQQFTTALEKLQQTERLIKTITTYYPKWKPDIVARRMAITSAALVRVRPLADEERQRKQRVVAELEGPTPKAAAEGGDPVFEVPDASPLRANPLDQQRLDTHQENINRIRKQLQDAMTPPAEVARQENRVKELESQLRAAESASARMRAQLARAPMEGEVKKLSQQVARLEQERDAMAMALGQSRREHTETLARQARLEADHQVALQQLADIKRDLDLQRKTSSETITGLRRQMRSLQTTVESQSKDLKNSQQRIAGLERELEQSHDAYAQLRGEYDALATERDQMRALLNLSDAGRLQELIEQNTSLHKNLRETQAKYDTLYREHGAANDELAAAITDLAVAKGQINRFKQEKRRQDQHLAELQARLRGEERALSGGLVAADAEEIAMLRNVINRQLMIQERRKQQTRILLDGAKQLGDKDPKIREAIELLEGDDLQLTEGEQQALAGRPDAEFFGPNALDPERVAMNRSVLAKDIASYDRAATKAFISERLLPARELFQLILEENPGHVMSLCKLGVVQLRLEDPSAAADAFRRAVELEPANPYAHRMLGFALLTQGDLAAAEPCVRHSVELAQDDPKSRNLLGTICYRLGQTKEAEANFKAAITADPMSSEPYFNLAFLLSRDSGQLPKAREYYQQALERGAVPDLKLEQTLAAP